MLKNCRFFCALFFFDVHRKIVVGVKYSACDYKLLIKKSVTLVIREIVSICDHLRFAQTYDFCDLRSTLHEHSLREKAISISTVQMTLLRVREMIRCFEEAKRRLRSESRSTV